MKKKYKIFWIIIFILVISFIYLISKNNFLMREGFKVNTNNFDERVSTLKKLQDLSKEDERITKIINNYDDYPTELLKMLTRDLEMVDFVLDYPAKFGNVYSDDIGSIEEGDIPLLIQWDSRWGYAKYGDSSIAISGCGPTALAMVIVGLTGDTSVTPYKVAKFAENNGYFSMKTGTSWELMTNGAKKLGIKSEEIPLVKDIIYNTLEKGYPIICSMRPGDFTTTGHFIVLTGIYDGKIKVNDSNSKKRSSALWSYEELQPQIKNLWKFSK